MKRTNVVDELFMMKEMIELQNTMNTKVSPSWNTMGWDWYRAMWLEAAEAVEHLPWKWWKQGGTVDLGMLKMEIVDIWHFILSAQIEANLTPLTFERTPAYLTKLNSLDLLAAAALRRDLEGVTRAFYSVMNAHEMDFEELYSLYIGKNVLNMFRQDNGYKDGTYRKLWNGVEDNKQLLEALRALEPCDDLAGNLYNKLTEMYKGE